MPKASNVQFEIVVVTTELARQYLGARPIEEGEKSQIRVSKGSDKQALIFTKSATNRPFRVSLAHRYAEDMITQRWAGMKNSKSKTINGETIIIDAHGNLVSGQHRLAALLLAEDKRKTKIEYYKKHYGCNGPLKFPTLLVAGIDPVSADTVDMGQKRSAGDVLYRQADLYPNYNKSARTKMCRWLGAAARLAWLKLGGKTVSDAPHLPHSELLAFIDENKLIVNCVEKLYAIEGETDHGFNSMKISQGYMAALTYLAMYAFDFTDTAKYNKQITYLLAWVQSIASGENLKAKQPAYELRKLYTSHLADGGSRDRDLQVVSPWVAAWNAEMAGQSVTQAKLKFKADDELPIIEGVFFQAPPAAEEAEVEEEVASPFDTPAEAAPATPAAPAAPAALAPSAATGAAVVVGARMQVTDDDGTVWIGTVAEDLKTNYAIVTDSEGNDWEVKKASMVAANTDELEPFAQ